MSTPASQAMASKAKAMYGFHLKANDYQELLRKNSVQEIASYLKNDTAYKTILSGINEQTVHRGFLEMLVRQAYYIDFLKLTRFGDPTKSQFYRYGVVSIEIKQILITIRNLGETDRTTQIAQLPMFANKQTSFDVQGLVRINDYDELLSFLRNTPYHDILARYRPQRLEDLDYTGCETSLKKYYYAKIDSMIEKDFSGTEQKQLKDLFKTRIELENLTMIYRLKKYYHASASKIKSLINPTYIHITKKELYDWIDNKSVEELIEAMKNCHYHIEFEAKDLLYIEQVMDKVQYRLNKRILRFSTNPDIILVAYLTLMEIEIQNIIDIIEGVRYRVDQERISKMLIY